MRYKEAYLAAGRLYADAKSSMSSQHVAAAIEEETGVSLSHQTVLRAGARVRAAEADGELLRVRPRGRPSILDQDQEAEIVKYIQLLRSLNLPVFSKEIRNVAFEVARKANGYTRPDGRERMSRGWLTCFFARWDLELKGTNALESDRDAYFTPANVKTHFDILSKVLLDLKYATSNPNYDDRVNPLEFKKRGETIPTECQSIFLTPMGEQCLLSFDETDASLDATTKSRKQRTIVVKGGKQGHLVFNCLIVSDKGESRSTKDGQHITLVAGSTAAGHALPAFVIAAGSLPKGVLAKPLLSPLIDQATGKQR